MTRGDEPSEDSAIRSAGDAARRLAMYRELRAFTAWLLWESRSVASRLSREAQAAAALDLAPLEAELHRFEERCRVWERRSQELERGPERARTGASALAGPGALALVEPEPRGESPRARTEAALAWSRESRQIATRAQLHSRAARERATAMKAKARQVSELATRTRSQLRDGAAVPSGPVQPA